MLKNFFTKFTSNELQNREDELRNQLKKLSNKIEYKLLHPFKVVKTVNGALLSETIDIVYITPFLPRHLMPKIKEAGESFSYLTYLKSVMANAEMQEELEQTRSDDIITVKIINKLNEIVLLDKKQILELEPIFDDMIMTALINNGLLVTKKGWALDSSLMCVEGGGSQLDMDNLKTMSQFDWEMIIDLVKHNFFLLPQPLLKALQEILIEKTLRE